MSGDACTSACGWCGRCTHGVRPNAVCPQCREEYYRGRHDDGFLCDVCCSRRDALAEYEQSQKLRMARATLTPRADQQKGTV